MPSFYRSLCALTALLLAAASLLTAEPLAVPRIATVAVDGDLGEWTFETGCVALDPALGGEERKRSTAGMEVGDLRVEICWGWTETGLLASIRWADDHWETAVVRGADRTWPAPDGSGELDRMYLYDNLVVRLVGEELFYGVWLAPRVEPGPVQWDQIREGPRREPHRVAEIGAARAVGSRANDSELHLELIIPWGELRIAPTEGTSFELRLIAADSDCVGSSLEEKYDGGCMKRQAWFGSIELR